MRWSTVSIGIVPFRKATNCMIHVSGGEFNCAANLSDCFGLRTGIVTAMADYPIGDLIAERVRSDGGQAVLQTFQAWLGVNGPNMATVFSDRGQGSAERLSSFTTGPTRRRLFSHRATSTGMRSSLPAIRWFHSGGIFASLSETTGELIIKRDEGRQDGGRRDLLRPELPGKTLEPVGRRVACPFDHAENRRKRGFPRRERRRTCSLGWAFRDPRSHPDPASTPGPSWG